MRDARLRQAFRRFAQLWTDGRRDLFPGSQAIYPEAGKDISSMLDTTQPAQQHQCRPIAHQGAVGGESPIIQHHRLVVDHPNGGKLLLQTCFTTEPGRSLFAIQHTGTAENERAGADTADPLVSCSLPLNEPVQLLMLHQAAHVVRAGDEQHVQYRFIGNGGIEREPDTFLDALGDASLSRLHTQLLEAGSVAARIGLVEGWLLQRLSLGVTRSALIPVSLARLCKETAALRRGSRRLSIPELAQDLAVSQRQLEHLYRSQVGMSPSQYFRLQRVETARLALAQQKQSTTQHFGKIFIDQESPAVGIRRRSIAMRGR